MRLIVGNRWFWLASSLILAQQALVGASTWLIGSAGKAVMADPADVLPCVARFFAAIAAAYLFGACAMWTANRLGNDSWHRYCRGLFDALRGEVALSSDRNKAAANAWLCGEALSTLEAASSSFVDMLAIYLNIVFTLAAFFALLGPMVAASVAAALVVSFLLLAVAHGPIDRLAARIQEEKLGALLEIGRVWDYLFFGNAQTQGPALTRARERSYLFFRRNERYKLVEQVISCLPVLVSMPLLLWAVTHEVARGTVALGAVVAVLPRSLQLFQNIHTANAFAGQLILMRAKLANLEGFPRTLERQDLEGQVRRERLSIVDAEGRALSVPELSERLDRTGGRYIVSGPNGSGKSSLLRALKARCERAVLLGPNVLLEEGDVRGSTGERQRLAIDAMIARGPRVLMLDEWDANLDRANTAALDGRLDAYARGAVVVEIRHRGSIPEPRVQIG